MNREERVASVRLTTLKIRTDTDAGESGPQQGLRHLTGAVFSSGVDDYPLLPASPIAETATRTPRARATVLLSGA
jgi:hypothetical protein